MATNYNAAGQAGLANKIQGLREAKAAFQALPEITRDAMNGAIETTVREIARGAQARILSSPSVVTRALYKAITWKVTKTNGRGRVGVAHAGTSQGNPARYAHLVEFGTRHSAAEPFMRPAAEAEKQPHLARCKAAGKVIEQKTAAVGLRHL